MPPNGDARVVSDHKLTPRSFYHKIGLTFVGLTILVGLVYAGYAYYAMPVLVAEQGRINLDAFFQELLNNQPPFDFIIVPDATDKLMIPEPVKESTAELNAEFETARQQVPTSEGTDIEWIYDMPVGDITYLEYLNEVPREMQDPLLQMHGEVELLVAEKNKLYTQTSLAARVGRESDLRFPEALRDKAGQVSVYPSQRVAEAYFIGEVLARQFPEQASFFREYVKSYIQKGVAYGHYSSLDADMTMMLVADYLTVAEQNEQGKLVLSALEQ